MQLVCQTEFYKEPCGEQNNFRNTFLMKIKLKLLVINTKTETEIQKTCKKPL